MTTTSSAAVLRPWDAPEITGWHRLPMTARPLPTPQERLSLDGEWAFELFGTPEEALQHGGALTTNVEVPGLWTRQRFEDVHGVGDLPHYTNIQMPFPEGPPHPPSARNPTGVYEREFAIPVDWAGRRVVLHVGAAESVVIAQVDGVDVGVGKDGHLASEFDITDVVLPGQTSQIRLTVVKWSDATYIEDQDQWWHAGISRPVFVYSMPPVHLADVHVEADADGALRVRAQAWAAAPLLTGWTVRATLTAPDGHDVVLTGPVNPDEQVDVPKPHGPTDPRVQDDAMTAVYRAAAGMPQDEAQRAIAAMVRMWRRDLPSRWASLAGTVDGVTPWSAETPALYPLTVELLDPSGAAVDETTIRVGFRTVEVVGRDLLVNGARPFLRGVNRHDFHPVTGRVLTTEDLRADLVTIKRFGFNAVRTSHYPNDPALYDLADELGLFVIDEADIECHAYAHELPHDVRYRQAWVERVGRMVQRDRNHPSVILWSLGNESGYGANHDAAAGWVRDADPTRPLHYEGAIMFDWFEGEAASDVVCPMYPPIDAIVGHTQTGRQNRPLIMCEFSHAMGNSNGTLAEYWEAIESTPGLQGGFIWEFWDHGLLQTLPGGRTRYAYGGDFGEHPHDGNFVTDGMVFPDRTPKPAMWEALALAAPLRLRATLAESAGVPDSVVVTNALHFRDSSHLAAEWHLVVDAGPGTTAAVSAVADLPALAPGESASVAVPSGLLAVLDDAPDGEAWLTLDVTLATDEPWAAAGTWICSPQVRIRAAAQDLLARAGATLTGEGEIAVDDDGLLVHAALAAAPRLSLWRAPTDNDRIGGFASAWEDLGLRSPRRTVVDIRREAGRTTVSARYALAKGAVVDHEVTYARVETPSGTGVLVQESATVPDGVDDLPRIGTVFEVAVSALPGHAVDWFGRGPWETYPDRRRAGSIGRFGCDVGAWFTPYIRPQESGGRADVRWLRLGTGESGLGIVLDEPRQVSLTHHRAEQLAQASHHDELTPIDDVVMHLDAVHRGLGTASCGPDTLPQYRLGPGTYRWSWLLLG